MKRILEIILTLLLMVCVVILCNQSSTLQSNKETINKLEEGNLKLQDEREILKKEIFELEDSIAQYSRTVEIINGKIDSLRQRRYEKVNVIVNLPLDKSVEFLSNYLSKDSNL